MALSDLKPAPYNPRLISKSAMDGLKASISKFGLVQPVIWNQRTGYVVGGHQRVQAMRSLGEDKTNVIVVDLDGEQEKALNLALNNPHIAGEFTDDVQALLIELNKAIPDDFAKLQLDKLLAEISAGIEGKDLQEDVVPDAPSESITKPGDMIALGDHVLLCGDSTDPQQVQGLLRSSPRMIFTDPPWNVAIGQDSNPKHRQREGLQNDDLGADFSAFLQAWTAACLPLLAGDLYCVMGCGEWPGIDMALREAGMHWSGTLVWVKDSFVLGRSNYHRRFEPIWYGWPAGHSSSYCGGRDKDDVWEVPRPKVSKDHPTMKPINLIGKAIQNSSLGGDVVFDPFGGAGSTLIACELLGRKCSTVEIEPRYCDVIISRWEKLTGRQALR